MGESGKPEVIELLRCACACWALARAGTVRVAEAVSGWWRERSECRKFGCAPLLPALALFCSLVVEAESICSFCFNGASAVTTPSGGSRYPCFSCICSRTARRNAGLYVYTARPMPPGDATAFKRVMPVRLCSFPSSPLPLPTVNPLRALVSILWLCSSLFFLLLLRIHAFTGFSSSLLYFTFSPLLLPWKCEWKGSMYHAHQ